MIRYYLYCINCGDQYTFYKSGNYFPKYNDDQYCPVCKEAYDNAIHNALSVIPKKSKTIWIETNEVNLDTILKWEKDIVDKHKKKEEEMREKGMPIFPLMKKVYANMWDQETNEHSCSGSINTPEGIEKRIYSYFYWPSKKQEAVIKVHVRVNMEGKILEYLNNEKKGY
jgi:hypothetical protein